MAIDFLKGLLSNIPPNVGGFSVVLPESQWHAMGKSIYFNPKSVSLSISVH